MISTVCVLVLFTPKNAFPEDYGSYAMPLLKLTLGIVSGIALHEGAHAAVAGITNTHLSWEAGTFNQPIGFTENADSDSKGIALYSAGLVSQLIASEVVLQVDCIDKNDAFVRGFMLWNILNPILYSIDYWLIRNSNKEHGNSYQGDIEGIEHYSNERTAQGFAIGIAAIAAFQGYRYVKTQTWAPEWMKGDTHNLSFAPMPEGGIFANYIFRF